MPIPLYAMFLHHKFTNLICQWDLMNVYAVNMNMVILLKFVKKISQLNGSVLNTVVNFYFFPKYSQLVLDRCNSHKNSFDQPQLPGVNLLPTHNMHDFAKKKYVFCRVLNSRGRDGACGLHMLLLTSLRRLEVETASGKKVIFYEFSIRSSGTSSGEVD